MFGKVKEIALPCSYVPTKKLSTQLFWCFFIILHSCFHEW